LKLKVMQARSRPSQPEHVNESPETPNAGTELHGDISAWDVYTFPLWESRILLSKKNCAAE